ncbi:hypothetical protein OROGR_000757 [Orobanche gracilis]
MNLFGIGTTLFHCRFQTEFKYRSLDVFNKKLAGNCETGDVDLGNKCVWSVMEDGFYLSNKFPPTTYGKKIYDW